MRAAAELQFVPDLAERSLSMAGAKRAVGAAALSVIPDDGTVIFDSGTTTARPAETLTAAGLDVKVIGTDGSGPA